MNAIQFIKENGVEKAREVVEGAPDKTASHYVISKRPHYYSVDFQSYFNNGDWYDSDYTSEQDLANDYEPQNVIRISDLKRLVDSVDLIGKYHSIDHAKNHYNNMREALNQYQYENKDIDDLSNELKQAIADYEEIYKCTYCNGFGEVGCQFEGTFTCPDCNGDRYVGGEHV